MEIGSRATPRSEVTGEIAIPKLSIPKRGVIKAPCRRRYPVTKPQQARNFRDDNESFADEIVPAEGPAGRRAMVGRKSLRDQERIAASMLRNMASV